MRRVTEHPTVAEPRGEEVVGQRAGEVLATLGPVEARTHDRATACGRGEASGAERLPALRRDGEGPVVVRRQSSRRGEAVVDADSESPRQVPVAGAGVGERRRHRSARARHSAAGHHAEMFEQFGRSGIGEPHVAMTALGGDLDEAGIEKHADVLADRRGRQRKVVGQLGVRVRGATEQRTEDAGAGFACHGAAEPGEEDRFGGHGPTLTPARFGALRNVAAIRLGVLDDLASARDPYPAYAELRRRGVHRVDDGRWVVARSDDVRSALNAPDLAVMRPSTGIGELDEAAATMARFSEGAEHRVRRRVAVDAVDSVTAAHVRLATGDQVAGALASPGSVDLTALVRRVTAAVLAAALGFRDPAACADAVVVLASALAPPAGSPRPADGAVTSALESLGAASPSSDPVVATNQFALLFQALDATTGLVTNTVLAMASTGVAATPELDSAALVDETARWDPAVQSTRRITRSPIMLGGRRIGEGEVVVVLLAASNRDAALVDRPDVFDPSRRTVDARVVGFDAFGFGAFGFGAGHHVCPGDHLGLALAAGVVDAVRSSGRRVESEPVRYERRPNLRIVASLMMG